MEGEVMIVAVDASNEITDYALEWAVCNVVKANDTLILLAVLPGSRGRPPASGSGAHQFLSCGGLLKKWGLVQNKAENSSGQKGLTRALEQDVLQRIKNVCEHMLQQLLSAHNVKEVHTEVEVMANAQLGSVTAQAEELEAAWVILDRRLKKEGDCCLKQLNCNVVLMDHAIPKILRAVNPIALKNFYTSTDQSDPTVADMLRVLPGNGAAYNSSATTHSGPSTTSPNCFTNGPYSLTSAADKKQLQKSETRRSFLNLNSQYFHQDDEADDQATFSISTSYSKSRVSINEASSLNTLDSPRKSPANSSDAETRSRSGLLKTKNDMKNLTSIKGIRAPPSNQARRSTDSPLLCSKPESLQKQSHDQHIKRRHSLSGHKIEALASPTSSTIERTSSLRKAMSISIKHQPMPPPLCSICKHSAPIFGKTPRKFSYKEIAKATNGFSSDNYLAEGGYGTIYRGVLPDGQVVAVKQHKMLSAQGASEFVSEVEVLSCAKHRNLVTLVGYCIETEWLLIYEFACNGSLDMHLYGKETNELMSWNRRMKVAKGAARGLRYLHEDCRVGCIVHRDFRPSKILLTHDFKPMVGDFGLARWQADGHLAEETRVIGAVGYLAPEYIQTGLITEKADVYALGVVLLELLSGIKAADYSRNTGKQFVVEWGHPLLEKKMINEIMDPRLEQIYVEKEVECMMYAASLCISPNPEQRPTMSKVLKILEGDIAADMVCNNAGQCASNYPKKDINNINGKETPIMQTPDSSNIQNLQLKSKHRMNLSPSNLSSHKKNDFNVTLKPLTASTVHEVVTRGRGMNQSDVLVSEEYQAYLQGSLARFIENLKER